ncbi:MFS transporter [Kitasatospora sp. NPDC052896]|uniref:MFS transporter n=1 Tax=Kitasatospora sp. NPDC052896 TaxID=3364061 RepID=UPI0037C8C096
MAAIDSTTLKNPPVDAPLGKRWWALVALTLSILVIGLDTYVLATALPTLSAKLGATTSQLQWISAAYTLAWSGLLLPAGKLGDRLGRRKLLITGLGVFGVASVIASQVKTANELIATRALMGAGAAMIMTLALALVPVIFPEEERNRAITVTTIGTMLGMPLGPLLGGWMLTHFAWGWVFLINGPVIVLSLIGVFLWVPESKDPTTPKLDWLGALMVVIGVSGMTYGIIEQPIDGWSSAKVLVGLVGGLLFMVAFVLWQRRAASPLVDLRLFLNRHFTWGSITFGMVSFAMMGGLFVLTPYLQLVQGASPQSTGVRLLPLIGAMLTGAAAGEKPAKKIGAKAIILLGIVVTAGGLVLLSSLHATSGYGSVALGLAVFGLGLGLSIPLSVDTVLSSLPLSQAGTGNGMSRTMQNISVSFSSAIIGSVLNSGFRNRIADGLQGLSGAARDTASASVAGAHSVAAGLPGDAGRQLTSLANTAYTHGMAQSLLVSAAILAVTAVLTLLFLPRRGGHQEAKQD